MAQLEPQEIPGKDYTLWDFDSGTDSRIHVYGLFHDPYEGRRILFLPDQALNARLYMENVWGDNGWSYFFADRGWTAFTFDLPGSNQSPPPADDDLVALTEDAIESVFRTVSGIFPRVVYAQGLGAAFAIKLRSTSPDAIPVGILVDPWGVRDVNPRLDLSSEQLLERQANIEDYLWVEWGIGPKPGTVYKDSDLGEEGFQRLLQSYDRDAPAYWATVSTGLQTWMQIMNPTHMAEWPVLVVRGAHATPEMDARREAVITWLEENGAYVELMDLGEEGPPGLSNLPMAGRQAGTVVEIFFDWAKDLPDNPQFPVQPTTP